MQNENRPNFRFDHIGVNCENEAAAMEAVSAIATLFGIEGVVGKNSIFSGPNIEVMKHNGPGEKGHIGFSAPSLEEARAYLERLGVEFDMASAKYDDAGRLRVVYMKQSLCGFALHLIRAKDA